ncbi:hypothetical protein TWF569_008304 [Orbilia oligospora]|nr:hypothetical protein TWF706_006973 [Orbilia oligospora]KAF3112058.1 hypothetical protein TWF102_005804 [Orbilia oligospora]KAF3113292.1 hypothetical protein TWF103_002455 [Orbilia oligospora]KAF3140164.1 hypothetical protein TWF569_008304 [Orbilia oligospora]KAF3146754.1 hypothetical protein TWF703_004026 [Orbilia oligospora]
MSTIVLAAAALLVLYGGTEMALETCSSASETSNSTSKPGEEMETISHNSSSRMQRRHSSIALIGCFFPTRSNGNSTRSFGSFRRKRREASTSGTDKDKPKYVHIPQHAADSHARTTTPLPFTMRPLSQDFTPARTPGPIPFGMRPMSSEITIQPATLNAHFMEQEHAKKVAGQGGRVHIVGSVAS